MASFKKQASPHFFWYQGRLGATSAHQSHAVVYLSGFMLASPRAFAGIASRSLIQQAGQPLSAFLLQMRADCLFGVCESSWFSSCLHLF